MSVRNERDSLQLANARERERIPLARIRPRLLDCKTGIIQQGIERLPGEFVAVLGMDGFKGCELNAKLRGWDIYALIARALQMHLHARLHAIPAGPMTEAAGIEVRAEFSIEGDAECSN